MIRRYDKKVKCSMILFAGLAFLLMPSLQAAAVVLKIATISPDGATWMVKMRAGAEEIAQRTQGRVTFKFYPGGIMGTDESVLRKIRIGQLQGGAVIGGSLAKIYPDSQVYGLPLLFRSYEEVDYVRAKMDRILIKGLEERGFVTFGFAEGGFAYMMCGKPLRDLKDLKRQKVWVPAGDVISRTIFESAEVSPIPLPVSDVLTGLQTGLIDTITVSPIVAIALQWHTKVKYLTDEPLSYIYALLIIDRKAFKKINPNDQAIVRQVMAHVFKEINKQNREDNKKAREALKRQGITFIASSPESRAEWKSISEEANTRLVAKGVYSQTILDMLIGHLEAYHKTQSAASVK